MTGTMLTENLLAPAAIKVAREKSVVGKYAHTQRPARLAEPGPRYQHTGVSYLELLRSYYLTASLPDHVTKLVNPWGDKTSVVAYIVSVLATLSDVDPLLDDALGETAKRLEAVAEKLDDDAEWAERMRYYADEVRGLMSGL